jgi:beta-glucosidase
MTLDEKVSLLAGTDFWHTASIERLGIPPVKVTDGPHGDRTMADDNPNQTLPATCFPTGVALAATWNTDLIQRVGGALGRETRERGCALILGPCVNIHRSPLGGRNFESFSEDPFLASRMTVAYIRGVQSEGVGACVKHFALNNSEHRRMTISSDADERVMREIYFPSFEKAVKEAGVEAVMCSYNKVNGTYASENRWLLTEILKKEWGFNGPVISDWFAVHSTVPAANSGLDLEMPGPARYFGDKLSEAVKRGEVDEKNIDEKVARILNFVFKHGPQSQKTVSSKEIKDIPKHGKLAREAAGEAIVLLKNEKRLLPLDDKAVRTLAVIGPNAAEARIEGGGSSEVKPFYRVSPLEGLRRRCGKDIKIIYKPGCTNNIMTLPLHPEYLICERGSKKTGLTGAYYDNNRLTGKPVTTRVDRTFTLRWLRETSPVDGTKADVRGIRWRGYFRTKNSGVYTFGLISGGKAIIYVNNTLVVDTGNSTPSEEFGPRREIKGEMTLEAGKVYPITIEFRTVPGVNFPTRSIRVGCNPPLPADLPERAVKAAARADAAIVFAGLSEEYESEGFDRANMDLPGAQIDLINKVAEVNPRTVIVLNNGSPLGMTGWIDRVPAVLEAWYPGQEGGNAIAEVLFGDINPSGKLPDTFPKRLEDNPAFSNYPGENGCVRYGEGIFMGYRYYDMKKIEPMFPFGHGLSYAEFKYSDLRVAPRRVKTGAKARVSINVENTGRRAGKEVVQLYIRDIDSELLRPPRELKAFQKIDLAPGETQRVSFVLDEAALSYYDTRIGEWVAGAGEFEIQIGSSSRDIRARTNFSLLETGGSAGSTRNAEKNEKNKIVAKEKRNE